jgi:hypothetical protein
MRTNDTPQARSSVETPEDNHTIQIAEPLIQIWGCRQVIVETNDGGTGCEDVESLKDFVEGMSKWARGLDHQEHKRASGLEDVSNGTHQKLRTIRDSTYNKSRQDEIA